MKAGDTVAATGFLECTNEIVLPGTKATVKRVGLYDYMDVQFEGVNGLWNVAPGEVRPV